MTDWLPRITIITLLAIVVGVPVLMRPGTHAPQAGAASSGPAAGTGQPAARLIVITPHNEQIRFEIARAFNLHRTRQNKPPVEFDFRAAGGTSDLRKQLVDEYAAVARRALKNNETTVGGAGYDLFFGGGDYEHGIFARQQTEEIDDPADPGKKKSIKYTISVPIDFPPGMLQEIFPRPDIAGSPLYHKDRYWAGVVLASFGIVYNRDLLRERGLPEPATWENLTDYRYLRLVALADPANSGSITEAYNAILMRLGWTDGWHTLRRVFANARYFANSSTKVPIDVSAGEAAAGMCIDFYGRYQASAVAGQPGAPDVGYIDPPGMTKLNSDPVSILRGAPHPELAHEFVMWLLSVEGQRLWQRRIGSPDGPVKFELRRQPIRSDMYPPPAVGPAVPANNPSLNSESSATAHRPAEPALPAASSEQSYWTDDVRPFEIARPFPRGMPSYYDAIATLAHAMAVDVHDDLVAAWSAINRTTDPVQRAKLEAIFDELPDDLRWPSPPPRPMVLKRDSDRLSPALLERLKPVLAQIKPDKPDGKVTAYTLPLEAVQALSEEDARELGPILRAPELDALVTRWRADKDAQLRDRLRWTAFFREKYAQVVREARH